MQKKTQFFEIKEFPWAKEGDYMPKAMASLSYDDEGFEVYFKAYETPLRMTETEHNTAVCEDSCVEFFVQFDPENDNTYINFEMNPICTMCCGRGEGRHGRVPIPPEVIDTFPRHCEIHDDYWEAWLKIPLDYIMREYPGYKHEEGTVIKANFYKCGNDVLHPHFATWNYVVAPKPDYHRPEYFKEIIL